MAPEYAGLLNALANTLGNYCGFVTAAMAGFLFDTLEDDEKAWNYIFIINGGIALTCGKSLPMHLIDKLWTITYGSWTKYTCIMYNIFV